MAINSKLQEIITAKLIEIQQSKLSCPLNELQKSTLFSRQTISLKAKVSPERPFIIAEFKRNSPAKGPLKLNANILEVVRGYQEGGASAISILTEQNFFLGNPDDLIQARKITNLPLLRKDFILDSYQIFESKAWGADLILLIAAILSPEQIIDFSKLAKSLGLEVILEIHEPEELIGLDLNAITFLGINNRNLNTFATDYQHSLTILDSLPVEIIKISESGISDPLVVANLFANSYQGFLIGEFFMRQEDSGLALKRFSAEVLKLIPN